MHVQCGEEGKGFKRGEGEREGGERRLHTVTCLYYSNLTSK